MARGTPAGCRSFCPRAVKGHTPCFFCRRRSSSIGRCKLPGKMQIALVNCLAAPEQRLDVKRVQVHNLICCGFGKPNGTQQNPIAGVAIRRPTGDVIIPTAATCGIQHHPLKAVIEAYGPFSFHSQIWKHLLRQLQPSRLKGRALLKRKWIRHQKRWQIVLDWPHFYKSMSDSSGGRPILCPAAIRSDFPISGTRNRPS